MGGTSEHLGLAAVAVFMGSLVQGVLGFGCSLVWMAIFPLFTSIQDAVGVLQPMAIGLNTLILTRVYLHATPNELKPLALSVPFGIGLGLWVVTSWSPRAINAVLGSFLILYTFFRKDSKKKDVEDDSQSEIGEESLEAETLMPGGEVELPSKLGDDDDAKPSNAEPRATIGKRQRRVAMVTGFAGGCLTSAFGTGGPAILVYAEEAGWKRHPETFRANLQLVFFSTNVLAIISQIASGIINEETFISTLILMPAMFAGGVASGALAKQISREKFQFLVVNGLRLVGLTFLAKAIR